MEYEWDPAKAAANVRKHRVLFSDAIGVLEDDSAVTILEEEERWVTVGTDSLGRILVVIYVWHGDAIRIISARLATPHERHQYEGLGPK